MLSWLFKSGTLNRRSTDVERITAIYYDHGYINVKIGEPKGRARGTAQISFKIDEGSSTTSATSFAGTCRRPARRRRSSSAPSGREGQIFRASILRDDVTNLTDFLGDGGYAFANVEPETLIRAEDKAVLDVTFRMSRGLR
jgi:outer membrane protein insertion porin family